MSSNPEITLERGRGWENTEWDLRAQAARRAAQKAALGLREMGIRFEEPKQGKLRRVSSRKDIDIDGYAWSANDFEVLTQFQRAAKLRLVWRAFEWSEVVVHEAIHCARKERFETASWSELAASEGLAYLGADEYRRRMCATQLTPRFYDFDLTPSRELEERFMANYSKPYRNVRTNSWFNVNTNDFCPPAGDLFGMQRINQHLLRGHTISDLLYQPAEELLGL
jgi:hypothetical protein